MVGSVRPGVAERAACALRIDHDLVSHGVEAEVPAAHVDVRVGRLGDLGQAHDGKATPLIVDGEETPVIEHVAGHGICDVVRGYCESFDGQSNLPRLKWLGLRLGDSGLSKVLPIDFEVHGLTLVALSKQLPGEHAVHGNALTVQRARSG